MRLEFRYQLVDSEGMPYKRSTSRSVRLKRSKCSVETLCEKIQRKHRPSSGDALLDENFPISDLWVYKNQEAFSSNIRLNIHDSIAGYGTSDEPDKVLVVVVRHGLELDLTLNQQYQTSANRYKAIAARCKEYAIVREIIDKMKENERLAQNSFPFMFVDSSSGSGKTQLAFTLMDSLQKERKVFYLVGSNTVGQDVYRHFQQPSAAFMKCIEEDMRIVTDFSESGVGVLSLYTFGFIKHLIENGYSTDNSIVMIPRCKIASIKQLFADSVSEHPLFILDEFPSFRRNQHNIINQLRLMRNVFRAANVHLMIMGTDSTAANLIDHAANSRHDRSNLWCCVFSNLPPFNQVFIPDSLPEFLKSILSHSRPWFSRLALEYISSNPPVDNVYLVDYIQGMAAHIADTVYGDKNVFGHKYGKFGQSSLFLNTSFNRDSQNPQATTKFIHRHFAQLVNKKMCLRLTAALNDKDQIGNRWTPRSYFPSPMDDTLLFMCLTGLPGVPAIRNSKNEEITFVSAVQSLIRYPEATDFVLDMNNANQVTNDGMKFEAVMAGSVCLASHVQGFRGCSVLEFLNALLYQIGKNTVLDVNWFNSTFPFLADARVPYLCPPNQKWPDFCFKIPDAHFGNFSRSKNGAQIDFLCETVFRIECKDTEEPLSLSILCDVIERIPVDPDCHLNIVLTNKLQDKYFTRKTYDETMSAKSKPICQDLCFYRSFDSCERLIPVTGLPTPTNPKHLVLLIDCFP